VPSKAWQNGSTRQWRRIRGEVLVRDGWRCQLRLEGCTTRATQVHHTVGKGVTGDSPEHLVAACEACNQAVGDPTKQDPPPKQATRW